MKVEDGVYVKIKTLFAIVIYVKLFPHLEIMANDTSTKTETKQSINTLLVVLLVIAAFLIGNLWTNVQYLKKGNTLVAGNQAVQNNQPQNNVINNGTNVYATTTPAAAAPQNPPATATPKITSSDHIRGDVNANLVLVEYSDLECPFCKSFHPTAEQALTAYQGKLKWVYRHFPLSFHQNAQKEAEASECVNEQGGNDAFWKFIDAIYTRTTSNGTGFALDKLVPLAQELGLDADKFKTCLDGGKYTKLVQDQELQGQSEGVSGTPGNILVNLTTGKTQSIPGAVPYDQLKAAIDQML